MKRGRPALPRCVRCGLKCRSNGGLAAHVRNAHPEPEVIERAKPNGHYDVPFADFLADTDAKIAKMQQVRSRVVALQEAVAALLTA